MINLRILEKLRTKEELINYFKQLGKEITEEELDAFKQSYGKAQESSGALTMQQLDDVAGGNITLIMHITPDGKSCLKLLGAYDFNLDANLEFYDRSYGANALEIADTIKFANINLQEPYIITANSLTVIGSKSEEPFKGEVYESTGDPLNAWRRIESSEDLDDIFGDVDRITIVRTTSLEHDKEEDFYTFDSNATIFSVSLKHAKSYLTPVEMSFLNWVKQDIAELNEELRDYYQDIYDSLKEHGLVDYLNPSVNPDGPPAKRQKTK